MTAQAIVRFTDVTLTDGDFGVWGGALTPAMASRLARRLDRAGLAAIEIMSPEILAVCYKRGEDPWRRVADLAACCPATPLRARLAPLNPYGGGAERLTIERLNQMVARLADAGVTEILCDDPLAESHLLAGLLETVGKRGLRALAVLPFVPETDDATYGERARWLLEAEAQGVQLRDEAGLLTMDRLPGLLSTLQEALGEAPLSLHLSCATGLGPQLAFAAMQAGVFDLDVALPTLANGPSVPSAVNLIRGLPAVGITARGPRAEALAQAEAWLAELADREGLAPAEPWHFDLAPWIHKLPGSAVAPIRKKLPQESWWVQFHAFAREVAKVRQECGALPPRFPFAQALAQQAHWHVSGLPRWQRVHPILARAIRGAFGALPAEPEAALAQRLGRLGPETRPAAATQLSPFSPLSRPDCPEGAGYRETTPAEALALGLLSHLKADGFFQISVTGPDLSLTMTRGRHA